ncbi:unnamed protein product [Caenorhabditis bovis]|uniref:Uncharacterized protein n=1 Tax=Caenorhabditis bovis TaxID=2654633 RepID=A0A8S1F2Y9_9PELO|nr:unnamed protein product [Caenorhabditis bovis]
MKAARALNKKYPKEMSVLLYITSKFGFKNARQAIKYSRDHIPETRKFAVLLQDVMVDLLIHYHSFADNVLGKTNASRGSRAFALSMLKKQHENIFDVYEYTLNMLLGKEKMIKIE